MSKIAYLSEEVIDQIAAGEVIESPASVVKELIENAIDAKAGKITLFIKGGGFEEIFVEDDGEGMSREEIKLSIKRHATSKIRRTQDLFTLNTMGFRGEALASIASISKMEIRSSQGQEGAFFCFQAGEVLEEKEEGKNQGTAIRILSLFYNVPARKAFQKSSAASLTEILRYVTALALSHYEIEFTLFVEEERKLFAPVVLAFSDKQKLQERLQMLHKEEICNGGRWLFWEKAGFSVFGFLSSSEVVKRNRLSQYLFINRRWVVSPQICSIVKEMYGTNIAERDFPCFSLFLQIPKDQIDVNVHPQKKEVRIQNFSFLRKFLWEAFFDTYPSTPNSFSLEQRENFMEEGFFFQEDDLPQGKEEEPSLFSSVFFFHMEGKFLLGIQQEEKKLLLVNVSLLHEALFGKWLENPQNFSQALLEPVLIELTKEEIEEVDFFAEKWREKGVEVRKISERSIAIDKIPSFLPTNQVYFFIKELLYLFSSQSKGRKKGFLRKGVFQFEEAKALYNLAEKEKIDKTLFQRVLTEGQLNQFMRA